MIEDMLLALQTKLRHYPLMALGIYRADKIENQCSLKTPRGATVNGKIDGINRRAKVKPFKTLALSLLLFSSISHAGLDQSRVKVSATVIDTNQHCQTVDQYQMCWPSGETCLSGDYTLLYLMLGKGKRSQPLLLSGDNRVNYCNKS